MASVSGETLKIVKKLLTRYEKVAYWRCRNDDNPVFVDQYIRGSAIITIFAEDDFYSVAVKYTSSGWNSRGHKSKVVLHRTQYYNMDRSIRYDNQICRS